MSKKFSALPRLTIIAVAAILGANAAQADQLEVLHWWTSGGEAKAVGELKKHDEARPHVEGLRGCRRRGRRRHDGAEVAGDLGQRPGRRADQGPACQEWAEEGVLADSTRGRREWKKYLPPEIDKIMQYDGHYVAAPFSVHRVNWLWINKAALNKAGGKVPTTLARVLRRR